MPSTCRRSPLRSTTVALAAALFADWAVARTDEVRGSAHLFAPDGTNAQNPGITIGWIADGGGGGGAAIVTADDPTAIDDLVRRAAG